MTINKPRGERKFQASKVLPLAVLSIGLVVPPYVSYATTVDPSEIIVTARRTKEDVQTVPIAVTVFNQDMLSERNVTNASDLVAYTPSLNVNNRFGADQASFAIRGFTQELRTTASVAVYFADVVAPRGSGNITAGDGAGPGSFFDLQNVQVLKGPQGTLFGRNTTGGAMQLVPQEPTSKLEGYLEESRGNYNMGHSQGVFNLPINERIRARFGIDTQKRDGYLVNTTGVGPDRLADINYLATRSSLMIDVTDSIRNYSIFSQTHSKNHGSIQKEFACNPKGTLHGFVSPSPCPASLAEQGSGFYNISSTEPDPVSKLKQWQFINTTTWEVNNGFTLKNILSYADLEQTTRGSVFGTNWHLSDIPGRVWNYADAGTYPGTPSNAQNTLVEELQASGTTFNDKLKWIAGYYFEDSRPDGWSGSQSPSSIACILPLSSNSSNWDCLNEDKLSTLFGGVAKTFSKTHYNNQALYSQGTYDISDAWKATLGLRYTVDTTKSTAQKIAYSIGTDPNTFPTNITCIDANSNSDCITKLSTKSEAPTWLFDVDYFPTPDTMVYAKYSRGYRQGSVVAASPEGYQKYDPEKVDAYELGTKTTFHGVVSGTFNSALFYNKLKNQQLQLGLLPNSPTGGGSTTAIQNAGESTIKGAELEATLRLTEDLTFNLGYTYLEAHLDSATFPSLVTGFQSAPAAVAGEHLTFSPRHTVVTGLNYHLPFPSEIGDISAGANYTFTSSQTSSSTNTALDPNASAYALLPARQLLNLNLGWKAIYGSPFDASFFMTNAFNKQYYVYVAGLYNGLGTELGVPGEPRMWGGRVKYNFY